MALDFNTLGLFPPADESEVKEKEGQFQIICQTFSRGKENCNCNNFAL